MVKKKRLKLVGIDIGTTHCKAGLFDEKGRLLHLEKQATVTHQSNDGRLFAHRFISQL